MIDKDGFRSNVGIILANNEGRLLWAKRVGQASWQFPQGGVDQGESSEQALYRELQEEIGLVEKDVEVIASTQAWLKYTLPKKYLRTRNNPGCIGQKQKWYLLRLLAEESNINLASGDVAVEFDHWRWVSYWYPLSNVIDFKKDVYRQALKELSPHLQAHLGKLV
ncbi:MAG TPA: RNA pyrophosphohydrolase [Pseudomonadales bacterium]